MNHDLSGKRALVCGASQGIGRACAAELARRGCRVTLVARDAERLARAAEDLATPGGDGFKGHDYFHADLGNPAGARTALEHHLRAHPGSYHIFVANTGGPPAKPAIDASEAELLAAFTSQLLSAHAIVQSLLPGFRQERYGRIITITSTSVKSPIPNLGISNIVRPAVAAWAKCLATELGPLGVTANNVLPGYTATDRLESIIKGRSTKSGVPEQSVRDDLVAATPAGRFGQPEEIAAAVAFLASPAAGYINGINLPVDGGRLGTL